MEDKNIDYESVLEDLYRRREDLNRAIAAIERISGAEPRVDDVEKAPRNRESGDDIRPDSFFQMSVRDGAIKLLKMKKKPMTAKEIEDALASGGMISSAKNFYQTVYTGLKRGEDDVFVQHPDTKAWGLASWYPTRPKWANNRQEADGDSGDTTDDESD